MFDLRPVGYLLGILVAILGGTALIPATVAFALGESETAPFVLSAFLCISIGAMVALACTGQQRERLNIQQVFLLTTTVWLVLPLFGALPFWLGAPGADYLDAFFEAMSGMTTTGATVFIGLDDEISISISYIYVGLTMACFLGYAFAGMSGFDALVHALTTIATGGYANSDMSFGAYQGAPEYVAVIFMILASLPFVRYVQLVNGSAAPLWRDSQIRLFFKLVFGVVLILSIYRVMSRGEFGEAALREALFNVTSIITGTGYASADYQLWGPFAVALFFFIGLIGGCAGSTCCSVKVFRYQLLFAAIATQIRQIHSPNGLFITRYEGRAIGFDVFSSVISFFAMFLGMLFLFALMLAMTGADFVTALSGAAAALANIGPGLGDQIGPAGNYASQTDAAKLVLMAAMIIGRLEILSIFVIFTAGFWRR